MLIPPEDSHTNATVMDEYCETRMSESPARTIDSRDSTTESVETIVDRKNKASITTTQQLQNNQATIMSNGTSTMNKSNKISLTNSEISVISDEQKNGHIYTSPDLLCPKNVNQENTNNSNNKYFDTQVVNSLQTMTSTGVKPTKVVKPLTVDEFKNEPYDIKPLPVERKCLFSTYVVLGLLQLILSLALAALGGLLIARGASLASSGSGLWSGGIAAIAGALGVINLRQVQTAFLAMSLVCVASSTLAIALTGIGLVRDINRLETTEFNVQNTEAAISAGGGLIFTLILHFILSIVSVYQAALKLCLKYDTRSQISNNVTISHNVTVLSKQKVEDYIKSMMGKQLKHIKTGTLSSASRPVMLVPATLGNGFPPVLPPGFKSLPSPMPQVLFPQGLFMPGCVMLPPPPAPSSFLPYISNSLPPGPIMNPESLYKMYSIRMGSEISGKYLKRRTGKNDNGNHRQRRKSDSDIDNHKAFIYTGLDRIIANNFLERQELSKGTYRKSGCSDVAT